MSHVAPSFGRRMMNDGNAARTQSWDRPLQIHNIVHKSVCHHRPVVRPLSHSDMKGALHPARQCRIVLTSGTAILHSGAGSKALLALPTDATVTEGLYRAFRASPTSTPCDVPCTSTHQHHYVDGMAPSRKTLHALSFPPPASSRLRSHLRDVCPHARKLPCHASRHVQPDAPPQQVGQVAAEVWQAACGAASERVRQLPIAQPGQS
jgi:hypothetical protein